MNNQELSSFKSELEKNALMGKVLKKIFMPKKRINLGKRIKNVKESLGGTALVVGGIGSGGLAYGAVTQPNSIYNSKKNR